jgi:hypothetical protein
MQVLYKRPFLQFVKKAKSPLQLAIEDAVVEVSKSPELGEQKKGDLRDIFVYKFRFNKQEYLIAYRYGLSDKLLELIWIDFYKIGTHENFYGELKRFLREEGNLARKGER